MLRSTTRQFWTLPNPTRLDSSGAWTRRLSTRSSAPDLLLAIKKTVDEDYSPGRFLLTGSANVLTLPRVADSLAGRMVTLQMLPLAQAEIEGRSPSFLERLIAGKLKSQPKAIVGDDLVHLVSRGGFPEAIARESERRQRDWARSYLTSILTRDLRHIADVEKLTELSKFVRLLAAAPLSALWS